MVEKGHKYNPHLNCFELGQIGDILCKSQCHICYEHSKYTYADLSSGFVNRLFFLCKTIVGRFVF